MRSLGLRFLLPGLIALCGAACSHRVTSRGPDAAALAPAALCTVAGTTAITLSGDGFDTMVAGALTDSPDVVPPAVMLQRTNDATGAAVNESPFAIPGTAPGDTGVGNLRWHSRREMTFDVDAGRVPAGVYDVIVEAPGGQRGTLKGGLVLLPPPRLDGVELCGTAADAGAGVPWSGACSAGRWITVIGDGFVQRGITEIDGGTDGGAVDASADAASCDPGLVPSGAAAALLVTGPDGAALDLGARLVQATCRSVEGSGGWARCAAFAFRIEETLPAGSYAVAVVNPEPFGCRSTQPVSFTCSAP